MVTGASRGLGAAIAAELARAGANVTLLGRDRATLSVVAERIAAEHSVRTHVGRCDVANEHTITAAFSDAKKDLGDPHILVNNAGIAEAGSVKDTSRELWDRTLAINVTGAFLCCRHVLPAMLAARAGRIVNIASVAGLRGARGIAAYVTSKHALIGLTRALALETAKHGITVNAVCPGYANTDMATAAVDNIVKGLGLTPEQALEKIAGTMPIGRLIEPAEVAAAVLWLCGGGAAAVTGQSLVVAGGEVT